MAPGHRANSVAYWSPRVARATRSLPAALRGRDGLVHRLVDAEDLRQPGDLQDLQDPLLRADQVQRAVVGPHPLQAPDQHPEAGGVEEPDLVQVDDELAAAPADQVENFDAYTGGACGKGPIRVLASSFMVDTQLCQPASYTSLQITSPGRNTYTSGTVDFEDADANPITGLPTVSLDSAGTASLSGLNLTTAYSLPQFLITLTGASSTPASVTATLTWTGTDDASCLKPGTTTTGSTTATCPPLKFFGVRGSGEKSSDAHGYGVTIDSVKNHLHQLIPGMQPQAIDYPAIPVQWWDPKYPANYVDAVDAGVKNLDKVALPFMVKCPHTYEDWAGYSQGVSVITQAFANLTEAQKQHVLLQAFGDPDFNPNQDAVDYGNYNKKLSGILVHFFGDQPTVYENRWAYRVQSWCAPGDPICNYSKLNLAACVPMLITGVCLHQWYVALGYTGDAATYAYKLWKSLPPLK